LGWIYFFDCSWQWTAHPQASIERSVWFAQKALALDDSNCAALALLSNDYIQEGQFDLAVTEGERAVNINPNCSIGYTFLASALNGVGMPVKALRAFEQAPRLGPGGRDFRAGMVGTSYSLMGRFKKRFHCSNAA